jgi:GR25 family glycosyltransferase involved in LPS biosynthesis
MSLLQNKWKIYIISVKESEERREHVNRLVDKATQYGFEVEIIDAFYWKTTNVLEKMEEYGIQFNRNVNLTQSQIACFLSHRLTWSKIYSSDNDEIAIILEDDMDLTNFELFCLTEKDMMNIKEYDSIIMYKYPEQTPKSLDVIGNNLIPFYFQWGLCAYTVSKNLCERLMEISYIDDAIDNYLNVFPEYNIYFTAVDPFTNYGYLGCQNYNSINKYKSLLVN